MGPPELVEAAAAARAEVEAAAAALAEAEASGAAGEGERPSSKQGKKPPAKGAPAAPTASPLAEALAAAEGKLAEAEAALAAAVAEVAEAAGGRAPHGVGSQLLNELLPTRPTMSALYNPRGGYVDGVAVGASAEARAEALRTSAKPVKAVASRRLTVTVSVLPCGRHKERPPPRTRWRHGTRGTMPSTARWRR